MAEQIKELIEKIQREGIETAENQASQIKKEATQKAAEIIEKATVEAHNIVAAAQEEAGRLDKHTRVLLQQASRDMLLGLRKEMMAMLDVLVEKQIKAALKPEDLARIIAALIKDSGRQDKDEIIVTLKKEDLEKLQQGFLGKLQEETKAGIVLKPSEDILGGFVISFDAGKSHYDFTDKALAEYIGTYLKPALKDLFKHND